MNALEKGLVALAIVTVVGFAIGLASHQVSTTTTSKDDWLAHGGWLGQVNQPTFRLPYANDPVDGSTLFYEGHMWKYYAGEREWFFTQESAGTLDDIGVNERGKIVSQRMPDSAVENELTHKSGAVLPKQCVTGDIFRKTGVIYICVSADKWQEAK